MKNRNRVITPAADKNLPTPYEQQQEFIRLFGDEQIEKSLKNDFKPGELKQHLQESFSVTNINEIGVMEKQALKIFDNWNSDKNKKWWHYSIEHIGDGQVLDARIILELISDVKKAISKANENPYDLALKAIRLGEELGKAKIELKRGPKPHKNNKIKMDDKKWIVDNILEQKKEHGINYTNSCKKFGISDSQFRKLRAQFYPNKNGN